MKKLLPSLSLPIGILMLVVLAVLPFQKEKEIINGKGKEKRQWNKKWTNDHLPIKEEESRKDSLIKKKKTRFTEMMKQPLLSWNNEIAVSMSLKNKS